MGNATYLPLESSLRCFAANCHMRSNYYKYIKEFIYKIVLHEQDILTVYRSLSACANREQSHQKGEPRIAI